MKTLAQRMKEAIDDAGVIPADLARACKITPTSVSNWLSGETKSLKASTAMRAAEFLGVNQAWLAEGRGPKRAVDDKAVNDGPNVETAPELKPLRSVPLVGEVKGGADGYLEELDYPVGHGEGMLEWPTSDPSAYALRVRGDSMFPRYRAGEFVVVEPSVEAPLGEDVVVCMNDGRKMLKVLNWIRDGEAQLLSINNGFAPLTVSCSDIRSIHYAAGRAPRSALRKQ